MSQIRNELRQLCQLQTVDLELSDKRAALQQVQDQIGKADEIENAKMQLLEKKQSALALKEAQKPLETEIQDIDERVKKLEGQLYEGGKGPKELTAMQQDIESQKERRKGIEEKNLEILVQVEAAQAEVTSLEAALESLKKDWAARQEELKKKEAELKAQVATLQEKRNLQAAPISDATLKVYETVRATKGQAVARVERGMCKGCRLILPVSEWQRVRTGALVKCSSCGRILCLE